MIELLGVWYFSHVEAPAHIVSSWPPSPQDDIKPDQCARCDRMCASKPQLENHFAYNHHHCSIAPCNKCGKALQSADDLAGHKRCEHCHIQEPPIRDGTLTPTSCACDLCGKQSETNDRSCRHIETSHGETTPSVNELNSIPQYDGILDDDDITGLTEREIYLQDPALLHTAYTVEEITSDGSEALQQQTSSSSNALNHNGYDMQYKYRLNTVN